MGLRLALVLFSLALIAIPPVAVDLADVAAPGDRLEIITRECVLGAGWSCTFVTIVRDPALAFFRYDLKTPLGWDYPLQSEDPLGTWTIETTVTRVYDADHPRRVCVQGWDGISTRVENGTEIPDGPIACTALLLDARLVVLPNRWSHRSEGRWVTAMLSLPSDVDSNGIDPQTVELNGIPATAWPVDHVTRGSRAGGHDWMFKVERSPLTEALGPGAHVVYLRGTWEDGVFLAADGVIIL